MSVLSLSLFPRRGAWLLGLGLGTVLASTALAFPPAPPFTIHGIARDPYGWALKAVDQGTVVIKRNGAVIAQAPIQETARPGENFRALLSMDSNAADPYRAGAQVAGVLFSLEVRFPSPTLLVSSISASWASGRAIRAGRWPRSARAISTTMAPRTTWNTSRALSLSSPRIPCGSTSKHSRPMAPRGSARCSWWKKTTAWNSPPIS